MGAVETLIVWENFDVMRYVLRNPQTQETKVLHLRSDQEKEKSHFQDKDSGVELEHVEEMPLLEWFANNYKNFGNKKKKNSFFLFLIDELKFQVPHSKSSLIKVKKVHSSFEVLVVSAVFYDIKSIFKI
jgi:hypothetical protein